MDKCFKQKYRAKHSGETNNANGRKSMEQGVRVPKRRHEQQPSQVGTPQKKLSQDSPTEEKLSRTDTHGRSSPVPSCVSMKSDMSMKERPRLGGEGVPGHIQIETQREDSEVPSFVSNKSDMSMKDPPQFSEEENPSHTRERLQRPVSPVPSNASIMSDSSMKNPPGFSGEGTSNNPIYSDSMSVEACKNEFQDDSHHKIIEYYKISLVEKSELLSEDSTVEGEQIPLKNIYTELYITEGDHEGVNREHEVLQMEVSSKATKPQDVRIHCNDIFKLQHAEQNRLRIQVVVTKGIAGIGKTVSVQKFTLDWAEGRANKDVDLVVSLPFRALNLVKGRTFSLHELIVLFHPELKSLEPRMYEELKVILIFDGLDESRLELDFSKYVRGVTKEVPVSVLVTSLIKRKILPNACVWITSRPAATGQIPKSMIDRMTEIQGFNDEQKEEYFKKKIPDQDLAQRLISHIKASKSFHIMCHIPVFCWISAIVLQKTMGQQNGEQIPKTLTEMYIHFLIIQTKMKCNKYEGNSRMDLKEVLTTNKQSILNLANLAFNQQLKENIMFYAEDLEECGIDVNDATVHSGLCTEIFKEEVVLHPAKVYCFVHRSVQEFFAALFAFHCYLTKNMTPLKGLLMDKYSMAPEDTPLDLLLKKAVDRALESQSGHLDLFVRFLHGISFESNQALLQGVLTQVEMSPASREKTLKNLKSMQQKDVQPERWINILLCLTELHDNSLQGTIKEFLETNSDQTRFTLAHCTALLWALLSSDAPLADINLKKFNTSDEGRRRLVPAVRCCQRAKFACCNLTSQSCGTIAKALQSDTLPLICLDLSNNDIEDVGVKNLCDGLLAPKCSVETLILVGCNLTETSCSHILSVLESENSSLREVDLSCNKIQDAGLQHLSKGLQSPACKLETLRVCACSIMDMGCSSLVSALASHCTQLKELDLSYNPIGDSAVSHLAATLLNADCKLTTLKLADCNITSHSCKALSMGLESDTCPLAELDLSHNDLEDSGITLLSNGLKSLNCQLKTLILRCCMITEIGCSHLASALESNPEHLNLLDLSYNHPKDTGEILFQAALQKPCCQTRLITCKAGEHRLWKGPKKYVDVLSLDPETANGHLLLSEANRKATYQIQMLRQPKHKKRFQRHCYQVLCKEKLKGRYYWEVEWVGSGVAMGVAYEGINRRAFNDHYWTGNNEKSWLGYNDKSWGMYCSYNTFSVRHNNQSANIPAPSSFSRKVGLYLDWLGGSLSFYSVSSATGQLTHLYTYHTRFTDPVIPGFWVWDSSIALCI